MFLYIHYITFRFVNIFLSFPFRLNRRYGLKEEYADTLVLCRYCSCLFWKSFGHPCVYCSDSSETDSEQKITTDLQPQDNQAIQQGVNQHQHPQNLQQEQAESKPPPAYTVPLHIPVPPQAFLKFFSL